MGLIAHTYVRVLFLSVFFFFLLSYIPTRNTNYSCGCLEGASCLGGSSVFLPWFLRCLALYYSGVFSSARYFQVSATSIPVRLDFPGNQESRCWGLLDSDQNNDKNREDHVAPMPYGYV